MRFPWTNREKRSGAGSGSYTDAVVQAILSRAGGATLAIPAQSAAVEMASGVVQRAFAAAEVTDTTEAVMNALDASCRGLIGREMLRTGEALFFIDIVDGDIFLIPVSSSTVTGDPNPTSWRYELTVAGPSGTMSYKNVDYSQVLHFRYSFDAARPWHGLGPLQSATQAGRLVGNLSSSLADEAGTPHGYVLPIPPDKDGQDESVEEMRADIGKLDGGLSFVESMAGEWKGSGQANKSDGYEAKRIGANPPQSLVQLHDMATKEILSAYGLSPALFGGSDGTSAREAWRQALHGLIQPLARIVEKEVRVKLESPDLTFTFDRLSASDISGRARAFQSLVGGGMPVADAAALSGLISQGDE